MTRPQTFWRLRARRGQATGELLAAMIGLTVAFALVFQIGVTGHESIENLLAARADADSNAGGNLLALSDDYVEYWDNGDDGLRHTADDVAGGSGGNTVDLFAAEMQAPVALSYVHALGARDGISPYVDGDSLAVATNLFVGTEERTVSVDPVLRTFLNLDGTPLHLNDSCYMPGLEILNPE